MLDEFYIIFSMYLVLGNNIFIFKEKNGGLFYSGLIWIELNMILFDRRMNNLLNKSFKLGYIYRRNGVLEF